MHFLYVAQLLIIILGPLVKMVLRILGFGFVTYVGFNLIIGEAQSYLFARMGDIGPIIQQILGLAKFDVVVNIYFAAITTRLAASPFFMPVTFSSAAAGSARIRCRLAGPPRPPAFSRRLQGG